MLLAAGFLARGSRQEKASVRLPCSGKKIAANERVYNFVLPLIIYMSHTHLKPLVKRGFVWAFYVCER
jgi:hypothetical protein